MSHTNNNANQTTSSAYDTGLFDESLHENQIVAMYDTDEHAKAAKDALTAKGVSADSIQLVSRNTQAATDATVGTNAEDADAGVWGAIKSLFVPDEDRSAYSHAVGRGHAMLVVHPAAGADRSAIVHALEATNPVDFDARLEEWRQAGYDTATPHQDYTASMPPVMDSPVARLADADPVVAGVVPAPGTKDYATSANYPTPAAVTTGSAGSVQPGTPVAARSTTDARADNGDTIKVMEERLRVGKREVAAGAVRIRSYIVERPVEEQVSLHSETVKVERRPVDRAASAADVNAFQERTIEARASAEEAVISKEARVVEEIGLTRTGSDRVETVHDTVRKTEVEVEDGTSIDPATGKPRRV